MMDQTLYIVWQNDFNTGINIIDEQHRALVCLINSLYFWFNKGKGDEVLKPIVHMLLDLIKVHFPTEELILSEIDSLEVKRHHKLHDDLLSKIIKLNIQLENGADAIIVLPILKQWIFNHALHEDKRIIDLYKERVMPPMR